LSDDDDIEDVIDKILPSDTNCHKPIVEHWIVNYKTNVIEEMKKVMDGMRCTINLMDPVTEETYKEIMVKIYYTVCQNYECATTATEIVTLETVTDKFQKLYEKFYETYAVVVEIRKNHYAMIGADDTTLEHISNVDKLKHDRNKDENNKIEGKDSNVIMSETGEDSSEVVQPTIVGNIQTTLGEKMLQIQNM